MRSRRFCAKAGAGYRGKSARGGKGKPAGLAAAGDEAEAVEKFAEAGAVQAGGEEGQAAEGTEPRVAGEEREAFAEGIITF